VVRRDHPQTATFQPEPLRVIEIAGASIYQMGALFCRKFASGNGWFCWKTIRWSNRASRWSEPLSIIRRHSRS